ncbi:MAG TPA: hypothetical protein VFU63_01295 [Ktedonobacterales bacterium]|nr:hypothetical protein [Ktedonobacterales bacterium]
MSWRSRVLFGAFSVVLSMGLAAVGAIPLIPPLAFGSFFVVLTIVLLVWHRSALGAYHGSGVVVFSRGPWTVIVGLVLIEAVCALDVLVSPINDGRIWLAVGYFLFGILYLVFLPSALDFWVADNAALVSQILAFKRALSWEDIDWIYLESTENRRRQFYITIARWNDEQLIVEAGPRRSMQVRVRAPLAGGAPLPILEAIRARAVHAAFGFDQLPAVQARRRGYVPSPQPEPNVSLPDAVEIARGSSMPASWTRFPVRQGIIWRNLLVFTALAVFMLGGALFIVMSGTVIWCYGMPRSWLAGPQGSLVVCGEGILCVGVGLWLFFSVSLRWLRTLRHPQDCFFLVTPRYVAEVNGRKVVGVALADVWSIHRSSGGIYGWKIVLNMRKGKKTEYDVGSNYGPSRDLYAYILAALNAPRRPA